MLEASVISILQSATILLFKFIEYAIFIDVILSWILQGRSNQFIEILHIFTEPFMKPGRMLQEKLMPGFMLDFSPILALIIISILQRIILSILMVF